MGIRTTHTDVEAVLGNDWDKTTNVMPYIKTASVIVDRVAAGGVLSANELERVECWLSAYFYTKMDPTYQSKSTGKASASFVAQGQSLDATADRYKRAAIELDYSGALNAILNRHVASAVWLGKPPSQQTPIDQRD